MTKNAEYFSKVFRELLKQWQNERRAENKKLKAAGKPTLKWSGEAFGALVSECRLENDVTKYIDEHHLYDTEKNRDKAAKAVKEHHVTKQQVDCWYHGKYYPHDYDQAIADALGVDLSAFDPYASKNHNDRYKYSLERQREINDDTIAYADQIGLSISFAEFLQDKIDMENEFPVWSPLRAFPFIAEIRRQRIGTTEAPSQSPFQLKSGDKFIDMSTCDLAFMNEVQQQVVELVRSLFDQRRQDMEAEVAGASDALFNLTGEITDDDINKILYDFDSGRRTLK